MPFNYHSRLSKPRISKAQCMESSITEHKNDNEETKSAEDLKERLHHLFRLLKEHKEEEAVLAYESLVELWVFLQERGKCDQDHLFLSSI
jgi:hypothetical protein